MSLDRGFIVVDDRMLPLTGDPWDQLPLEPDKWFERFLEYARPLGYDYLLRRAFGAWRAQLLETNAAITDLELETERAGWEFHAERWLWAKRAEMWAKAESRATVRRWTERRKQLAESDWGAGAELRALAGDLLELVPKFLVEGLKEIDGQQVFAVRLAVTPDQLGRLVQTASALQQDAAASAEAMAKLEAVMGPSPSGATTVAEALAGRLASGEADEVAASLVGRVLNGDNAALRELRQFVQGDTLNVATDYTKLLEQLGLTLDDVQRRDPALAAILTAKRQSELSATAAPIAGNGDPLATGAAELSQSGDGQDLPPTP